MPSQQLAMRVAAFASMAMSTLIRDFVNAAQLGAINLFDVICSVAFRHL